MQFLVMLFDIVTGLNFFVMSFDAFLVMLFDIVPGLNLFVMSFDAVPGNVM